MAKSPESTDRVGQRRMSPLADEVGLEFRQYRHDPEEHLANADVVSICSVSETSWASLLEKRHGCELRQLATND